MFTWITIAISVYRLLSDKNQNTELLNAVEDIKLKLKSGLVTIPDSQTKNMAAQTSPTPAKS
jgi:hypothetical protein